MSVLCSSMNTIFKKSYQKFLSAYFWEGIRLRLNNTLCFCLFFSRQAHFRDETTRRSKAKTGSESFTHDCVHLDVIKPYIIVIQYRWKCNLNVNEDAWWSEKGYRLRFRSQLDLAACWSVRRALGFGSRQMATNPRVGFLQKVKNWRKRGFFLERFVLHDFVHIE